MITKKQKANAERIVELDRVFGHLRYNEAGQVVRETLNLSIPCAQLIVAGVVTGVADTNDGVTDSAVADVERSCANAVSFTIARYGESWEWRQAAADHGLDLDKADEQTVLTALWWAQGQPLFLHELENKLRATGLDNAERIAPVLDRLLAAGKVVKGETSFAAVWSLKPEEVVA